jgi:hypothetical protein
VNVGVTVAQKISSFVISGSADIRIRSLLDTRTRRIMCAMTDPEHWPWFVKTHSFSPHGSRCCLRLASAREDSKVASGANRVNRLLFRFCHRFWLEPTSNCGLDTSCSRFKRSNFLDYPMAEFHPLNGASFV